MLRLKRPIWLGDLAPRATEYDAYGRALNELVEEGRIVRLPARRGQRVYYSQTT